MSIVLILLAVGLFVLGIVAYGRWAEHRRTTQLETMAGELGLEFQVMNPPSD